MKKNKTTTTLKELYRVFFKLEERIEFLSFYIKNRLEEEDLTEEDIYRIEKDMEELEDTILRKKNIDRKLKAFNSVLIEI